VGSGNGAFLEECLRQGHDPIGVEPDKSLCDVIPEEALKYVIFKRIEEVDKFDGLFNVITFWDSFEHLDNSFELLNNLKPYLKENGIIYLRVNNNRDITNLLTIFVLSLFPLAGKRMLRVCFGFPGHVWNFSQKGMRNLLVKHGWRIIFWKFNETPVSRFTKNPLLTWLIRSGYLINRLIRQGKIAEYYISF